MDPALDPPPVSAQPVGALPPADAPAPAPAPATANPTPAHSVPNNHPPYAEMITAAITALNERDGSSKRAIAKYIETHYQALPPTHSALLTHHLKRLKDSGQLHMVKKSYALPSRSTAAAVNGDVNAVPADPASSGPKRRPGRPPKPKPDAGQAAVPVFAAPINMNAPPAQNAAAGPAGTPVRGRGRPPKRGPGRPPQSGGVGKRRGRPAKNTVVAPAPAKGSGRPRGRPPKPVNVAEGAPAAGGIPALPVPVGGKRRGRPPKAGGVAKKARYMSAVQPRKPRKSGKPVGRPRKNAVASTSEAQDSPLLTAYLTLNEELKTLKGKVSQTVNVIRPYLANEAAITALNELEEMAENVRAPPNFQVPPQPQQPQPQS
ncbi:hypothetical protein ACS0TY_031237 [Phlomoides rotata]